MIHFKNFILSIIFLFVLNLSLYAKYESNVYPIFGYSEDFGFIYGGYYFLDLPTGGTAGVGAMNSESGYRTWTKI